MTRWMEIMIASPHVNLGTSSLLPGKFPRIVQSPELFRAPEKQPKAILKKTLKTLPEQAFDLHNCFLWSILGHSSNFRAIFFKLDIHVLA